MDIKKIIELDEKYYFGTFGKRTPLMFTHGNGCKLYDSEGREYTDFFAGIATNCLGYAHEGLTKAVKEQAGAIMHCSNIYYIEAQSLLAEKLCSLTECNRVFFCNSGAEANEGAIKLARKYFYGKGDKRYEILTAQNSFHGRTMATLAATGQEKYHKPYDPLTPSFKHFVYNDIDSVKSLISDKTCAIMAETVLGEGGVIPGDIDFLNGLQKLCEEHGLLFILDEIQTGVCRTGSFFSFQSLGFTPDICTLAKALGGGIPIAAILAKDHVAKAFIQGDHGSTFGGNPLACASALYTCSYLLDNGFEGRVKELGKYLLQKLKEAVEGSENIVEIRGRGLLVGIELKDGFPAADMVRKAREKGYIIGTAGVNTLRLAPPLIVEKDDIDGLCLCLKEILM